MADDANGAVLAQGDSLTLEFKGRPVRALMVEGVPWFALGDMVAALGWHEDTIKEANDRAFPPWAKVIAGEGDGQAEIEGSTDLVLLSPIGVHFWTSFVDEWKGQSITAWAKRESRRLCPKPAAGDRNMFLTIVDRADGTKALPPYGHRYSGWKSDYEDLRWSNEWMAAEAHNRSVFSAQMDERAERNRAEGKTISDVVGDWKRRRRTPLGLTPEPKVAIV